ncbi:glycerol-3-phosphate 1-O-acyltransferase PlsY [Eremococcus coleocola]|uniref:glycerol-3-phosphate 1-O-acyltransferase PlsY n=1 Tax=Eremococcus coleocola TaxID=88132 RepID=UPI00040AAC1C|nr:glycerol-3-phosphate 1-O-acyltransferase PlsY [Eremococcus coleocola]
MNIIILHILVILLAYCIGSIPTGLWYAQYVHHQDIRQLGSGNFGATNIGRNFGLKAAVIVTVIDVLKGLISTVLAGWIFAESPAAVMLTGLAAALGHAYPIWAEFKGGKMVATSFGVLAGFNIWLGIIAAIVLFLFMFLFSIVSFAAMTSFYIGVILVACFAHSWIYVIGFTLLWCLLLFRHEKNLKALAKNEERVMSFGLHLYEKTIYPLIKNYLYENVEVDDLA